jgi:SAM-dependent methyltransferase
MAIEHDVARHYTHGGLERAILDGLKAMGRAPDSVRPEDLAGIDEFHIGGHRATAELADQLGLEKGTALLDLGSGLGGAARFFARRYGCRVSGVDLTPEYVQVAEALTRMVGLAELVTYRVGSVTDLPFADGSFDAATLLHVGMNIPDKKRLCSEVARVLRPAGVFAIYDVMRIGAGDLDFPVPWATTEAMSFLAEPAVYHRALDSAGLALVAERNRRDFAIEFFRNLRARMAAEGPPPLGIHILMGAEAPRKIANMIAALEAGRIAPVEMISRKL